MSKKTILMVSVVLAFIVGCQQQNLTWTPTAEEWTAMTPEQRNAWSANELRARRDRDEAWRKLSESNKRREPQKIIVVPQNYIDLRD